MTFAPLKKKHLTVVFDSAAQLLPETDFACYLQRKFGITSAQNVLGAFRKMGLPAPENEQEFMCGTEGFLVFLNRYGLVIRIENASPRYGDRINDSGRVLQPLAAIDTGNALIELCAGCRFGVCEKSREDLRADLRKEKIDFWDCAARNMGLLPVKTVKFPEGIPVVIDRLAVSKLTISTAFIRQKLKELFGTAKNEAREAAEAQEVLYGPLRRVFETSWNDQQQLFDVQKMQPFWDLCCRSVAEGKLIAGWEEGMRGFFLSRTAAAYEARLVSQGPVIPILKPLAVLIPAEVK